MYGMRRDKLGLLPHDPAWKDEFLSEKQRIEAVLQDSSVQIEHVGSTSIPSVHAKPILDLAILCGERGVEPVADALAALGYEYRGLSAEKSGHYYAVREQNNVRFCQAHIYLKPTSDWRSYLIFRDALREHLDLAQEYDDYKLGLAKIVIDKSEYANIKTQWIDTFILKVYARSGILTPSRGTER
jgi:GrpB-like predicted nucleotidyltransferase (UPF0157 family)